MPNMCYFQMKISGPQAAIDEFVDAIKWAGPFSNNGLGRAFSFDFPCPGEIEKDIKRGYIAVFGEGDCDNSILSSLRDYSGYKRSLESETKRLGLAVEYFSSETGCHFQEHGIIVCGNVLTHDCVYYEETFVEDKSEEYLQAFCIEKGLTREELMRAVNCNGDYCEGGFENFGEFSNLFPLLNEKRINLGFESGHHKESSLLEKIQSASAQETKPKKSPSPAVNEREPDI